jgi:preprotein translocase subunit YajC
MDSWNSLVATAIVIGIMYFVALRPQIQEKKAHDLMLAGLAKDDAVVTSGGLHGRIVELQADNLVIEVADKVRVKVDRSAITRKLNTSDAKK